MSVIEKRRVAALMGNGHIDVLEQAMPPVKPGTVLLEVHNSLVSPGTELGGWAQLRQQLEKPAASASPKPFGYSNAGVVVEVGEGVTRFKPGDRIACIGAGYALHSNYVVVPHHLCTPLPANVTFAQGSYAMLGATAIQALRRGEPEFGEYTAIVGMGLLGQITARMYQLAGNYVIGWDTNPFALDVARRWGIDATVQVGAGDVRAVTERFTRGNGLDAAVLAFGGNADQAYQSITQCLKCSPDGHRMGRIMVVGLASFNVQWLPSNADIRIAARTGPGYHDEQWEVGPDYPPVWMRWTTRTNLELVMRLISEGKLNVDCLTTHTVPLSTMDRSIQDLIREPGRVLGVVFDMKA
jgi:threonine dehydrogenase-like Zn-dependent dehydrogenase